MTEARHFRWDEIAADQPIPLLTRKTIMGQQCLLANVHLDPGCHVARHRHESEQIAVHVSGKALWIVGEEGAEITVSAGEVLHLPSNCWHEVYAIEPTDILDILSPPGAMGVDSQKSGSLQVEIGALEQP